MKKLLLTIAAAILSLANAHAQAVTDGYLTSGDIVSISFDNWGQGNPYYYIEANNNGTQTVQAVTTNCLWEIGISKNGNEYEYTFKHTSLNRYLSIKDNGNQSYSLLLSTQPTLFRIKEAKNNAAKAYLYGQIYYTASGNIPVHLNCENSYFHARTWWSTSLHIEKWTQSGSGDGTLKGYFSPELQKFGLAKDDAAAQAQAKDVKFVFPTHIHSSYHCVNRPELVLGGSEAEITNFPRPTFYWKSQGKNGNDISVLKPANYQVPEGAPAIEGRNMLQVSTPTQDANDKNIWNFRITPLNKSPKNLQRKDAHSTNANPIYRWVNYMDTLVAEYTYDGEDYTIYMVVERNSYHEEQLPSLVISVNPHSYTFAKAAETLNIQVTAVHQHGKAVLDIENKAVEIVYETGGEPAPISAINGSGWTTNLTIEYPQGTNAWITTPAEVIDNNTIQVKVPAHEGNKRSAILKGKLFETARHEHSGTFEVQLHQRGKEGGIQFINQPGFGASDSLKNVWGDRQEPQPVHTAERTIYYTKGQQIELKLAESGFSGYMRWYDYETGGNPHYNDCHGSNYPSTDWHTQPRSADGKWFVNINTPQSSSTVDDEGYSWGLYALHESAKDKAGRQLTAAMGAILDETYKTNDRLAQPAPILYGWNYTYNANAATPDDKRAAGYHTMACDVSAYTDYEIITQDDNTSRITSIKEPTLSYRQLFHLKPAEEIADKFAALPDGKYLEEYSYMAPVGPDVYLSTEFRHAAKQPKTEKCYFYWKDGIKNGTLLRVNGNARWYDQSGRDITPGTYNAKDYLDVDAQSPGTKTYYLRVPDAFGTGEHLNIAKFTVEFVHANACGPSAGLISMEQIRAQYKVLEYIDFNFGAPAPGTNEERALPKPLPWTYATYGFVYPSDFTGDGNADYVRGDSQGEFPYFGEYRLVNKVNKNFGGDAGVSGDNHGGAANGYAMYVDGTMEPGMVASISTNAVICSAQTMYCSIWLRNPSSTAHSGALPIFRCNIQGRKKTDQIDAQGKTIYTEWEDAGVFFVGSIAKNSGWRQIVFPVNSANNYDETRVSLYNFATDNMANDFMIDDICLFVSQLPFAAYQGKMACRTTADSKTHAVAVLRLDYSNIDKDNDGYMYYQVYNENLKRAVNLSGDAAYYHEAHQGDHTAETYYGSVAIPEQSYKPTTYYQSVTKFLDDLMASGEKNGIAYVRVVNEGIDKYLLYVGHIIENTDDSNKAGELLYSGHEYTLRMAHTPNELDKAECNMRTPLHATQATYFQLDDSEENSWDDIQSTSYDHCANQLYFLTSKIKNSLALNAGGDIENLVAPIQSDWLVLYDTWKEINVYAEAVPTDNDELKDYNARLAVADTLFKQKYTYTRGQIANAILHDMRRVPTDDDPNPNYYAKSFKELNPNYFQTNQNYQIIKHLCDNDWLEMHKTTTFFFLGAQDTTRYLVYPIEGTAEAKMSNGTPVVLKDCKEECYVAISSMDWAYHLNATPIPHEEKTAHESMQLPTVKVLLDNIHNVQIPITDLFTDNDTHIKIGGKEYTHGATITIDLSNLPTYMTYMNMTTGKTMNAPTLAVGKEYTLRLQYNDAANNSHNNVTGDAAENITKCPVGYVFFHLLVIPNTMVWTPEGASFNGWGKNENWRGWKDTNGNSIIDEGELTEGYVPISGSNVVIPKLDNSALYPYIVPEEDHNHYEMTINFDPHHCRNIYFQAGAQINNQHMLQYEKAFVDMYVPAAKWNMMASPLEEVYSGDIFIPHTSYGIVQNPEPFEIAAWEGQRYSDAPYAFWQAHFNKTVTTHYSSGSTTTALSSNTAEFAQTNSLDVLLEPGTGFQLQGYGPQNNTSDELIVRLPKNDNQYYYYSSRGEQTDRYATIPRTSNHGKLAYDNRNASGEKTITLRGEEASTYFVFGNPTMAYIDLVPFMETNKDIKAVYQMSSSTWLANTDLSMYQTADRYLAPTRSILVEVENSSTTLTLTLKPEHLTLTDLSPKAEAEQRNERRRTPSVDNNDTHLMTIYAFNTKGLARSIVAYSNYANDDYLQGEDALFLSTGIDTKAETNTPTSPINLYSLHNRVPMMVDMRENIDTIPLAMLVSPNHRSAKMQMAFYFSQEWNKTCYLYDAQTDTKTRIMDGLVLTLDMPFNHQARYYIVGPDRTTNDENIETAIPNIHPDDMQVWAYSEQAGEMTVCSNDIIQSVTVYDITGRLIAHKALDLLYNQVSLPVGQGVHIAEVTLRDNSKHYTRAIVK